MVYEGRSDLKMWVWLIVLMTLSFSSVVVLRGAEQENRSGPPGMSTTPATQVLEVAMGAVTSICTVVYDM